MQSSKAKTARYQGPMLGEMVKLLYHQLAQPLAEDCQRRLSSARKQRQTLQALTAGDCQITPIPWSWVAKSFLGEGSEFHNTVSARNIFENSRQRLANHWPGILSRGFVIMWGLESDDSLSALGPYDCPNAWCDAGHQEFCLTFIPPCSNPCFPFCPALS